MLMISISMLARRPGQFFYHSYMLIMSIIEAINVVECFRSTYAGWDSGINS
jgi:hypothetical protein